MPRLNQDQFHQPRLPGTSEPKQMALFHTAKAGDIPANIYRHSYHPDASTESNIRLNPDEDRTLNDPVETERGAFFDWASDPGSSERQFLAYGEAHKNVTEAHERDKAMGLHSPVLGYDKFPERVNPDLDFDDLIQEEGVRGSNFYRHGVRDMEPGTTFRSPEGSEIAKVTYDEDEWGPNVHEAEVNPLYKGRGWTKPAMTDFVSEAQGVVHASGFTHAGSQAFHAKGIPTDEELSDELASRARNVVEEEVEEGLVPDTPVSRMRAINEYQESNFEPFRDEMEGYQKQGARIFQNERRKKSGRVTTAPRQFKQEKFF